MPVWCFQCRIEYVDEVQECVDCAGVTIDRRPLSPQAVGGDGEDQLSYEFNAWPLDARAQLDFDLWHNKLAHSWMAGSLIIRSADEELVDEVIDAVDKSMRPTFPKGAPLVEYDLSDYPDRAREQILQMIDLNGVAHQVEDGSLLLIQEQDEAQVDAFFDKLVDAEPKRLEFGPGIEGVDPLSVVHDLFVSADKIRKNQTDHKARRAFLNAHDQAHQIKLPWGYDAEFWRGVLDESDSVIDGLETDDLDLIKEHATGVSAALRTVL